MISSDMFGTPDPNRQLKIPTSANFPGNIGEEIFDTVNARLYKCLGPNWWCYFQGVSLPDSARMVFTYVSNGDTNGVFYYYGTSFGTVSWVNPSGGTLPQLRNNLNSGTAADMTNRVSGTSFQGNAAGNYIVCDFGGSRSFILNSYLLRVYSSDGTRPIRNWKMQGTNTLASFDDTGVGAATWTDIDVRINDTTMPTGASSWGYYTVGVAPSAYRYIRLIQNGLSAASDNYLVLDEWEFYGTLISR